LVVLIKQVVLLDVRQELNRPRMDNTWVREARLAGTTWR
jgi:hypothetical protein